jgi:DNA-binding transcriptional ArsR family regulator
VDDSDFIDYRQWSMTDTSTAIPISREDATTWAGWFKALADPTRILILHLLATEGRPMNVSEIVEAMDVGQSTVSHHLQILGETCFVHVERVGTASWWRINDRCMACFPSAAELIMGRLPQVAPWDDSADTGDACANGTC